MAVKFDFAPIFASESKHQTLLQEQEQHARVIQWKSNSELVQATATDYYNESLYGDEQLSVEDLSLIMPRMAIGRPGEATKVLKQHKIDCSEMTSKSEILGDWLDYLQIVIELRGQNHTLVQVEYGSVFGFIDHETDTQYTISMKDVQDSRKKFGTAEMDEMIMVGQELGLSTQDTMGASRNPSTRAFILGLTEFNGVDTNLRDSEFEDDATTGLVSLEGLWAEPVKESFLQLVPEIGGATRSDPVFDDRIGLIITSANNE